MSTFYLTRTPDPETGNETQILHEDLLDAMIAFFGAISSGAEHVELVWSA